MSDPKPGLVDHLGRPLRSAASKAALQEVVARPSLTGVRQAWNAMTVASGLTPERLASILRAAADGDANDYLTLAEEMEERDWHYAAELGKRKLAVLGLDRTVTANGDDPKAEEIAEAVREHIIQDEAFEGLLSGLLDALGKGYAAVEIGWETGRFWRPTTYDHRDPRWFRYDRETGRQLRLLDETDLANGIELPAYRFAVHEPELKTGLPIRGGLARLAAWAFLFKFYGVKDWAAFAETYGQPIRLGKYGPNATPQDVEVLYQAVAMIGTDCAAVVPESMSIEFVEAMTGGGGDQLYQRWCDWLDRQVSKAVVGQSGTADVQKGGGYAQSTVLDGVRGDLCEADAGQLARTVRRDVIARFVAFNYGPDAPVPLLTLATPASEDLKAFSEGVGPMIDRGLKVKASEVRAKFGLSAPEPEDEVLGPQAAQTPTTATPVPQPAASGETVTALNRRAFNREGARSDQIDVMTAEALSGWMDQMAPVVEPFERLAAASSSYEEFLAGLDGALTQSDPAELARSLGAAFFKARALGDVRDEV
jgi:phage gp29-like protein